MELEHFTLDLGSVRLRAKDGLKFSLRRRGEEVWYLVEDEINGRFYRLGLAETTLLSLLDGRRTVRDVLALAAQFSEDAHLDDAAASGICHFLLQSGLISTSESRTPQRLEAQSESLIKAKRFQWLNPITITIPLVNPDCALSVLNRNLGFALGWPLIILGSLVILMGLLGLAMNWDELTLFRLRTYSAGDWIGMAAGWLVIKLIHEIGHGWVCKHLGGSVTQAGVVLFLFLPLPFVNTTSSWSFGRRSQRIAVVAAGIFFEMLVASLAMLLWANLEPGPWRFQLEDLILAAMIHTLVFNLNPLMKFDGYYLLSDFLELNNLSQQGKAFVSSLARKWLIDPQTEIPREPRLQTFIRVYGVAAQIWMMLVLLSLWITACNWMEGLGMLLAAAAVTVWCLPGLAALKRNLLIDGRWQGRRLKRLSFSLAGWVGGMALIGTLLPAPSKLRAPVVIDYQEQVTLHATTTGFIDAIHASPNQWVQTGDLLIEISNPDLIMRRDAVSIELKQAEIQSRVAYAADQIAQALVHQEKMSTLQKQLTELEQLIAGMQVRAPMNGEVLSIDLQQRKGTYLQIGDEILTIGNSNTLEARALIKQSDATGLNLQPADPSQVEILGGGNVEARVIAIAPRASTVLPHAAFAASHGGMLSVIANEEKIQRSSGSLTSSRGELFEPSRNPAEGLSLVEPHVQVRLMLEQPAGLRAGQIGIAQIQARQESLGHFAFCQLRRWINGRFTRSHGL